jgi:hypothetical protein
MPEVLQAVLTGHSSELGAGYPSPAADLLHAVLPAFQLSRIADDPGVTKQLFMCGLSARADEPTRQAAVARLRKRWPQLLQALRHKAGQQGTMSVWVDAGREIQRQHGRCWLATELALQGASAESLQPSSGLEPKAPAFGPDADVGRLAADIRAARDELRWWSSTREAVDSDLDAAGWALAFALCASVSVVEQVIDEFDALVTQFPASTRQIVLSASARVGLAGTARRLPRGIISGRDLSPVAELTLTHQLDHDDQQAVFREQLERGQAKSMAELGTPAWSVHLAAWNSMTGRLRRDASRASAHDEELEILRIAGPGIVLPAVTAGMLSEQDAGLVMQDIDSYPWAAIQGASLTLGRVNAHAQEPLGSVATRENWFDE